MTTDLFKSCMDLPDSLKDVSREIGMKIVPNRFVHAFLTNQSPKRFFSAEFKKVTYCFERLKENKKKKPKKRSRQGLSVKEKKQLNLLKIGKNYKYESFLPIHELWVQYMDSVLPDRLLCLDDLTEVYQILYKADYHGCYLVVAESKCPAYVGISGIVIMETKNTFKLVTKSNILKTIPKHNTIFSFSLKNRIFKICGSNILYISYERSKVKFKPRYKTEISL